MAVNYVGIGISHMAGVITELSGLKQLQRATMHLCITRTMQNGEVHDFVQLLQIIPQHLCPLLLLQLHVFRHGLSSAQTLFNDTLQPAAKKKNIAMNLLIDG